MTKRILVIISSWPSNEHPYLVYLFSRLKKEFPSMQMFLFKRIKDQTFAYKLIGAAETNTVLANALYRFVFTYNPFAYIRPAARVLFHPLTSLRIFIACVKANLGVKQAFGQLFYGNQLIGKQYDLVYINALQTGRHLAVSAFFPNSKVIASSRGQDFDWNPTGYDKLLSQLDHLHVLGTHLQQRAIERNFPIEKITIIPPAILPVKQKEHTALNASGEAIQIVTAARLIWTKGHVYSLRAVSLLKERLGEDRPVRYVILGQGDYFDFLKFEISRLGLEDSVVLKGWVSQDEVNQILTESHIYILLSIEEGFNNSVMQAQSLGVPCVVSDAGGLPDNVLNGITGFVVPRYNEKLAAEKLYELAMNKPLRHQMGIQAKVRMAEYFSLEKQASDYSRLFQRNLN